MITFTSSLAGRSFAMRHLTKYPHRLNDCHVTHYHLINCALMMNYSSKEQISWLVYNMFRRCKALLECKWLTQIIALDMHHLDILLTHKATLFHRFYGCKWRIQQVPLFNRIICSCPGIISNIIHFQWTADCVGKTNHKTVDHAVCRG